MRDTSVEAYHELVNDGVLSARQSEALKALIKTNDKYGAVTGGELFAIAFANSNSLRLTSIRSRLGELRDMGAVEERHKKKCDISGKRAITWHYTGDKAQKVNRISKQQRKTFVKDAMTRIYSQHNDPKLRADLKLLWNMIKEL